MSFVAGQQASSLLSKAVMVADQFGQRFGFDWISENSLYFDSDFAFPAGITSKQPTTISWRSLLPLNQAEADDFNAYLNDLSLLSATDLSDIQYQSFIQSIDTNPEHLNKLVRIPGYIVPIALAQDRFIKGFFLVPYFGACVHFPPPPANQMIYVEVAGDFPVPDVYQPYSVEGILRADVFEDPRGTSAYFLDVYRITEFQGEPDDVREHALKLSEQDG